MSKPQTPYDETDSEILFRIGKRFVILLVIIFMFDTLIDFFLGGLDIFLGILHIVIEFFEYSIELLLEHIFEANHHQSEIIIVNITLILGFFILFRFICKIPDYLHRLWRGIRLYWLKRKRRQRKYWRRLTLGQKIKIYTAYTVGFSCVLFVLTL